MDLQIALLVYVIVIILLYVFSRFFLKITIWSSIVLSAVIALIITLALCPLSCIEKIMEGSWLMGLYLFFIAVTFLLGIFYIIERSLRDIDYVTLRAEKMRSETGR